MLENVEVEARTGRSQYRAGDEVEVSVTVNNKGPGPVELTFASSQRYDFLLLEDGEEVWRWSRDKMFAMVLGHLLLEPGEGQTYTETWRLGGVPRGEYELVGVVTCQPPLRATCTFTVGG